MVVVMPLEHSIQSFWTGPARSVAVPVSRLMSSGGSLDAVITAMMSGDGPDGLSAFGRDFVGDVLPIREHVQSVQEG